MGIVESKAASSAQLKGAEEIVLVAGVGDSEMRIGGSSEKVTVGDRFGLCGYGCRGGWRNYRGVCLNRSSCCGGYESD